MPMVGGGISFQLKAAAGSERGVAERMPAADADADGGAEERLMQLAAH